MTTRKTDTLWLRLAALDDPHFGFGVPAAMCPHVFERLAIEGYVEIREIGRGRRAVITDRGEAKLTKLRLRAERAKAYWATLPLHGEDE